jgi:Domain of unknown function (DUF4795)
MFDAREEIDEATGNIVKIREEVKRVESDQTIKLFTIKNVKAFSGHPMGYPLEPIQVFSTEELQKFQADSIHEVMLNKIPSDDTIVNAERPSDSFKALFDFINASKRLDALEIGIRQLADVFKRSHCDSAARLDTMKRVIDAELTKLNSLVAELKTFNCKCSAEGFELKASEKIQEKVDEGLGDQFTTLESQMTNLKSFCQATFEAIRYEITQFKDLVCDQLKLYESDLNNCLREVQEMLDAKLDKYFVPELKGYISNTFQSLEEKIESVDCQKPFAAGVTKKIFKGLNCVSCGEDVIQTDTGNPSQLKILRSEQKQHETEANELQLLKLSTRLCGGRHTITTPKERVFRSENCQNGMNDTDCKFQSSHG